MDFAQIYATAASRCSYLSDKDCLKVYVGSSADDPTLTDVLASFRINIDKLGIKARAVLTGSFGYFDLEPIILIERPDGPTLMYANVTPDMASELLKGKVRNEDTKQVLAFCSIGSQRVNGIPHMSDIPLFGLQKRVALRNCGIINPEDIDHYIALGGGFSGLSKALITNRADLIGELKKAGLRVLENCDSGESEKLVVCNALGIDPQWEVTRLLLESDPHSVLEGMLITALAVGARSCLAYIDPKYSHAISRLNKSLQQMREKGLVGNNIMGSNFSCEIEIKGLSDSFIPEVRASLLGYMDAKRPVPHLLSQAFPVKELAGKNVMAYNAETLSSVSAIFQTRRSSPLVPEGQPDGKTRVFSLSGDVVHKYMVEVPFGTTLRSLIMEIAGGVAGNKEIKAVQFGGPTGVFLTAEDLDIEVNSGPPEKIRLLTDSGRLQVFSHDFCPVETTAKEMSYLRALSCGKCLFCREGSLQISEILKDIAQGAGRAQDLDLLIELGKALKTGSLCALGQNAPDLVLSGITAFRHDYESHLIQKRCRLKASD